MGNIQSGQSHNETLSFEVLDNFVNSYGGIQEIVHEENTSKEIVTRYLSRSRSESITENWVHWKNQSFKAGDILHCQMAGIFACHVLMATSDKDVIHFIGDSSSKRGIVVEEPWQEYHEREGEQQSICRNIKQQGRDISVQQSIVKARSFISKGIIYYNIITCNCEHMVCHWICNGTAYSKQTAQYVCQLGSI